MSCLLPPICAFCEHLLNLPEQDCLAFREIPDTIMLGQNDHYEALQNDQGYRFQLDPEQITTLEEINELRQMMGLQPFRFNHQGH